MTVLGQGLAPTLAFFALAGLAALTAAVPAAFGDGRQRGGSAGAERALAVGATVFLAQLAVFVVAAGMGAAPFVARAAALGLGVAATLPGAGVERGAEGDA